MSQSRAPGVARLMLRFPGQRKAIAASTDDARLQSLCWALDLAWLAMESPDLSPGPAPRLEDQLILVERIERKAWSQLGWGLIGRP